MLMLVWETHRDTEQRGGREEGGGKRGRIRGRGSRKVARKGKVIASDDVKTEQNIVNTL